MPIVFAQPEPVDAETFFRSGRSDAQRQNADLALRQQGQLLAAQGDFFRTAVASGEQRARAGAAQADLEQRQYEFREQVAQRDRLAQLESQTALAAISRRGQVQAFLQTLDPGFAEEQQYQRDLSEISAIQADRTLTQWEKDQQISGKITGVKMTRQRLEQAQAKQREALAQQELAYAQRQTQMADLQGKFLTRSLPERTFPLPGGNGWLVETQAGKWEHIKPEPPPKPMSGAEMRAEADIAYPEDAQTEQGRPMRSPEQQQRFNEYLGKIWQREQAKQQGGQGSQQTPGGATVVQPQVYDQKPFADGKPTSEYQRDQLAAAESFRARAERLPGDVKMMYKQKAAMLADIIRRGTPAADRELYDRLVSDLEQMPAPPPKGPSSPPIAGPASAMGRFPR